MDGDVSFGIWLEKRRKALDLTREELSQKVGCSISALRKIETDERRPSQQLAELLANTLDIPTEERATFIRIARRAATLSRLKTSHHRPDLSLFQSPQTLSNSISIPPTPLIGRERELSVLHQMLEDPQCRLITLVGPGGIGKTRLAMEVARNQNSPYTDGAAFISLVNVNSVDLIIPVIANALNFRFHDSSDPKRQLLNYLKDKQIFLVLDNLEHLLDSVGIVAEMIEYAPKVKLLCTSREQLNLHGEWVFEVGGLDLSEAVALFANHARRVTADFVVKEDNELSTTRICRLFEGMPLAIELAATWIHVLSLPEIEQEIQRNLDFLATNMRDVPERHHSIQAVFEHSWKLMTKGEQKVLSRLSLFRGGFTREAAGYVAGASLPVLASLVSKSLIQRTEDRRYHMHELLRQYTLDKLETDEAEKTTTHEQHYDFYLALAKDTKNKFKGPHQSDYLNLLEQEHDNLRAALQWSLDGHDDRALRLAGALRWFWYVRGHFHEGRDWLTKALQASPESNAETLHLRARALEGVALLTNGLGDHITARSLAEESRTFFRELGDKHGLADTLLLIGYAMSWRGETAEGQSRLAEALRLYREAGDQLGVARTLSALGSLLADWGGDSTGRAMLEESAVLLQELGDKYFIATVKIPLGIISLGAGALPTARAYFEQSLAASRETRHVWGMADALTNLGCLARIEGNFTAGQMYLEEALRIYQGQDDCVWRTDPLCALAELAIAQGNLSTARLHLEEASTLTDTLENSWLRILVTYFQGLLAYYEGAMESATVFLEETTMLARRSQYIPDLARSLVTLGRVMHARGDASRAMSLLREGLGIYHRLGHKLGIAISLEAFAGLIADQDARGSAKLFGAARAIRETIGAPLPPVDHPLYESTVATTRDRLDEPAFASAWAEGATMTMEQAIEVALCHLSQIFSMNDTG